MSKVDTQHEDYKEMLDRWQRAEDVVCGQHAIHKAATKYLPKLADQTDQEYSAYKQRASFYNATARTINALIGLIFRKDPVIEASDALLEDLNDVDLEGKSIFDLISEITEEYIEAGRIGLLVDGPKQRTSGMTLADVKALNLKPVINCYDAKDIINWRTGNTKGLTPYTFVVLCENEEIQKNEFETEFEKRYRVLDLINGVYRQRLFMINDKGEDVQIGPDIFPIMNGSTLDYIPFEILGGADVEPPPLLDLVDLNLAHYRVTADYEHGCHFTGLPTPVVSGYTRENESDKLYIGSTSAWVFPDSNAKASFLEFTGQGLTALENNLNRKENQLAVLGARILTQDKKSAEAAATLEMRQQGETSFLATVVNLVDKSINTVVNIYAEWAGYSEDVTVQLNKDFVSTYLDPQEMTALLQLWQSGAISQETLFNNLKSGELYGDTETFELEQAKIDAGYSNQAGNTAIEANGQQAKASA